MKIIDAYVPDDYEHVRLDTRGMALIAEFANWCRMHHVRLYAAFPNLQYRAEYHTPNAEKYFNDLLAFYSDLDVPVLGRPYDFMYGKGNFFDSVYHPYVDISEKHTRALLAILKSRHPDFFRSSAQVHPVITGNASRLQ